MTATSTPWTQLPPVPTLARPLALFSLAVLAACLPAAGAAVAAALLRVEVFSSTDSPVALELRSSHEPLFTTVYEVDGIERFQALLSKDLPHNPEIAKRTALTRIEQLDAEQRSLVRHAAMGLSKASQYGLDRYPAIVFDGRAVVYGVTSLADALEHHREWQEALAW
jgi:integrating conjugative element protein (TIGR03757 family)